MEKLVYSSARQEQEVELTDAQGTVKKYKLKEFSGIERAKYKAYLKFNIQYEGGEAKASLDNYNPMPENEFLSLCLFDENDKPVPQAEIDKLPSTTIVGLYLAGITLCGLNKEANDEAKND